MKANTKLGRVLCLLLTLVMLLRLFPVATVLAADAESHPTKVGLLGETHEAYYIAEGVFLFAENKTGSNSEAKWNAYKSRLNTKITEDAGNISGKTIEGVAYYDRASGVLYITGNVYTCVSAVVVSTARDDVLKVVVDGNTNNDGGWCVTEVNQCLGKLNIEFRNNGTLTLSKRSDNSSVLGVIGYNGQPGSVNWGTDPFWFGDLELSGTGKLKIKVSDDEQKLLCGIRARDISIKDNVSLDIKMGKSNASVMYRCNAAMICKSLTIDTTGTVQIDTALEDSSNRFSVFAPIASYYVNYNGDPVNSFNLVNAQSVTLKSNAKNELFDTRFGFNGTQNNLGDRICDALETKGWTVTKPDTDDAKPYTVTMTRAGMPTAAELTVGTQTVKNTADTPIPSVTVNGGEYVSLKASVTLPTWLSNMVTGSNASAKVGDWFLKIFEGQKLVGETIGGYNNSINVTELPEVSIGTTGFKPEAGKTYTVYACIPIVTKDGGKQLGSASVLATIKAVEKPDTAISSVDLTSPGMQEGAKSGGNFTGTNTGVASTDTVWLNDLTGGAKLNTLYTAKVTLTAENGYVFTKDTAVNVTNSSGYYEVGTPSISADGKTMTVRVLVAATHDHDWKWKDNGDGTHSEVCDLTGCNAERNTENHTYNTTETATQITYTCTKCGNTRTETKTGENVIWLISAPVTEPKADDTVSGKTWVTLKSQYAGDAKITTAKWTKDSADFNGTFEAGQTYTLTVTFTAKGEKAFRNPQLLKPLQCLGGTPSEATVSSDGKTLTQSITFTIKMPVSVKVTLNDLTADGSIVPPTIESGKAADSMLSVNINKGERLYIYTYSTNTWTKVSTGDGDATPKLAAGESATLGLALVGSSDEECIAVLQSTNNVKGLVAGAYAEKNGVYATYAVADETPAKTITSVDLTVTAPVYGESPANTTATGADGANYTVNNVSWNTSDATFEAKEYTVSISVTPNGSYTFADGCVYTVNGYTATYADGKVSYTFPALTAPHTHNYGAWKELDGTYHYQTCSGTIGTCDEPMKRAEHTFGDWQQGDATQHYKECSVCHHKVYADHEESAQIIDTAPTFNATGTWYTKCEVCHKQMNTGTIDKLVKIDVENLTVAKPVKDVAAAEATTTDTAYYVADTEWMAADSTVLDITNGDKFQPGTVYTVKITLETAGDGVFSSNSIYNQIDGKTPTVSPALTGNDYAESIVLTYTFDATEGAYVPTAPSISTATLPDGKVGEEYNQLLSANGSAPIKWSVESGNLPDGLTLNSANGTISGTPSKAGDFKFTVKATNDGGSDTKELTIKITDTEPAKYHDVTITGAGTGATGAGSHAAGTTVNIYAGTKSGYTFDGWTSDDVTILSASSKNASFVMPDKAVTVKANWTYNGGGSGGGDYTYYTIKATAGVNGSISPSGNVSVREGRDQTFTITPDKGYAVARVLIDSKNVGAVKSYTFENVKKNHTIEVVFMKAGGNPQTGVFVDVPEDSYYEEAVNWAVENGITTGTDATHFTPDGICTRAQAVTFLWRAAGSPAPKSTTMPFTDVKAGSYYYDAVLWAVENGITKGTSATEFSPAQNCSRAQIVTFLWRSEKSPAAGTVNPFTDVKSDAYYADAVLWAVKEDVTKGTTATTFSPNANCTRAQIVTFIWRALAE